MELFVPFAASRAAWHLQESRFLKEEAVPIFLCGDEILVIVVALSNEVVLLLPVKRESDTKHGSLEHSFEDATLRVHRDLFRFRRFLQHH